MCATFTQDQDLYNSNIFAIQIFTIHMWRRPQGGMWGSESPLERGLKSVRTIHTLCIKKSIEASQGTLGVGRRALGPIV